ncbi:myb/SANT-like DNA-binding domain-containing protein 4 [Episyrphus balteatus]|uniref:myb/SANT-like DNA-binding domain-containing protein 4 n=1 Tax=Episyrphus balteatus TaxID=286459 RepID=UPI0024864BC5|nr:myb/SANT-like DNA-binding domain-containing protein 4 [Episyrphus balteatus]XP_055858632.1 myb/SANT-like DNA-binding domain-containing protein 4 [Episyrphus balteatus]
MSNRSKRTSNFSKAEEEKLINLALQKKSILENKKTDAITSKQKDAAWEALAENFNATSEGQLRTGKVLKDKYNNIKRALRKSKADLRKEIFLTGGGPPPPTQKEQSPLLNELSDVMGISVDGLASRNDDDEVLFEKEKMEVGDADTNVADEDIQHLLEDILSTEEQPIEEKPSLNWQGYNPEMLRTKRHKCLNKNKRKKVEDPDDINELKKQILKQQLRNNQEEHQQKLSQGAEEHRLKMQILEAELLAKQK